MKKENLIRKEGHTMSKKYPTLFVHEIYRNYNNKKFYACRVPLIDTNVPFHRLIQTLPEIFDKTQIKTDISNKRPWSLNIYKVSIRIGDWVIFTKDIKFFEVCSNINFHRRYNFEDSLDYRQNGIVMNSHGIKVGMMVPIVKWFKYRHNDIAFLLNVIRKNGGRVEIHNKWNSRRLRIPLNREVRNESSHHIFPFPYQIAHPGEWVVVDQIGDTRIYTTEQLDALLDKDSDEDKAVLV